MLRSTLAALLLAPAFAGAVHAADADWPREIARGDGTTFVVYEPQLDSLDGDTLLSRSAVSIERPGDQTPVFGAVETTAKLDIDGDRARIAELTVDRVRFPGMREDSEEARELAAALEREAPRWNLDFSMADLEGHLKEQATTEDLRNTPPKFIYVDQPAILISIDGEPRLRAVGTSGLERVVNTPFPVVYDRASKRYYFYGSSAWFATSDLTRGRWSPVSRPPANVVALFADSKADPKEAPPLSADQLRRARILVATEPTELISTDGRPAMQPLVGSELLTVSNTDSDLFFDVPSQTWYIVVSGRWYQARSLTGSWSFVESDRLPASFARIPPSSPKSDALAHIAGTEAAQDAVMDAAIPQVAAVDRDEATFSPTYDGPARFEPIPNTQLRYAVNTASQVILADDHYYAVEQGVWFIADSPYGPWRVSETRPVGLDGIPASSPAYNTRYVYIYDVRPDIIYMGYTPGYLWAFPYSGAIVYGTGYRYRPWYGPTYYYPRPWTWGFSAHYSPWGGWNYGMSWNAGWMGLSWAWGNGWGQWHHGYRRGYNHGYWDGVHGGGWFGPGGYRPPVYYPNRPHYRPDARPVKGHGGGGYVRPQRWANNVYTRPDNANLAATRPSARYWNEPPGDRRARPQDWQRATPTSREPVRTWRPGGEPLIRPAPTTTTGTDFATRPADRRHSDNNEYRWRGNQWQATDRRDVRRPPSPSSGNRPILRPAQPDRPMQPSAPRVSAQPRPHIEPLRPRSEPQRPHVEQPRQPQSPPQQAPRDTRPHDQGQRQPAYARPHDGGSRGATRERGPIRER